MNNETRNELQEKLKKIQQLLNDENFHPGLSTWYSMFLDARDELLLLFGIDRTGWL